MDGMVLLNMKIVVGLFVVIGIYIFMVSASGRAAADFCDDHPVGSQIESLERLEGSFLFKRMGPAPDADVAGANYAIYCASLTMCDTSCRLTVKDGSVVEARFSAL